MAPVEPVLLGLVRESGRGLGFFGQIVFIVGGVGFIVFLFQCFIVALLLVVVVGCWLLVVIDV